MNKSFFERRCVRLMLPLLLLFVLLAAAPLARALDPAIPIEGYRHERWSEVDGAPGLVDAIAQTADGWLWIASRKTGLYRFDGVHFMPYQTRDDSRLQHTGISVLRPGPGNRLWIGHGRGGVSVLRDGRLEHFPALADVGSIYAIAVAANGDAWIAARRGLFRIRGSTVERIGAEHGFDGHGSQYVLADGMDRIWAADGTALYLLAPGGTAFRRVRQVEPDPLLIEGADGSVWVVLGKRLENVAPASGRPPAWRFGRSSSYQSTFDRDGNLWTGNCPVGLCVVRPAGRRPGAPFDGLHGDERLDQASQLTSLQILSVMVDREGTLWIGTASGLERLRDQPVHMVPELADKGLVQLAPAPDGGIVAVTQERMNRSSALWRIVAGKPVPQPNPLGVETIARASDGSLVLGGREGIERHTTTGVQRVPLPPIPVAPGTPLLLRSIAAGRDDIWLQVSAHGTWHYRDGQWTQVEVSGRGARSTAVDAAGRAWLAYQGGRLALADRAGIRDIPVAPGVDIGDIEYVHAGPVTVVSGTRGYGLVRNGRLEAMRIAAPGGIGAARGIAVGPDGAWWLNTTTGLFRVTAQDWARTLGDPGVPLQGQLFDALDGYVGGASSLWASDTLAADRDGRLWVAGERGLAWIAPGTLAPNPVAPDAEILGLTASGRRHAPEGRLELGTGPQDVEIEYAAPSLRMPQRVSFRYRLSGADWEDAGTRRTAFYRNLAPGDYTFEVVAINDSGVASAHPATLRLHVTPPFTQTPWFYAACTAAVALLLALVHRWRMRLLVRRIEDRFRIRVHERESIARSLHDTFLQSVQGLMFNIHALVMKLPAEAPIRAEFEQLLLRVGQVVTEGRDEVRGLRSDYSSSAEFWRILERDVALVVPRAGARLQLVEPEALDRLCAHLRHDVYAIVREAVVNALRHTAGAVAVRIDAGPKQVVVSVADEGPGLGAFRNGKPGHFGVPGMRERAALIGARLEFVDATAGGARIILTIPAAVAYGKAHGLPETTRRHTNIS
ncbi:Two component regulator propeller [Massilia sp. PDC64]|nr:two-component regulator propeller domain-containing protein [Massilia sp. PDC64]SDD31637.1 Two component regulator propeller [Massilia sp. PDC64]